MKKIVALNVTHDKAQVWNYDESGKLKTNEYPFHPWIATNRCIYDPLVNTTQRLQGDNPIRFKYTFKTLEGFSKNRRSNNPADIIYGDFNVQFLVTHDEMRLFQDLHFEDLKIMTIDLETTSLDPTQGEIKMIGVRCGDVDTVLWNAPKTAQDEADGALTADANDCSLEKQLIDHLSSMVMELDPDVIIGWNILGFDIPYLETRAEEVGCELNWGRDRSKLIKGHERQFRVGTYARPVNQYRCVGRHIIDVMLSAMRYDTDTGGTFESYGLKDVARTLGVAKADRTYVEATGIASMLGTDPYTVSQYCRDDVQETADIFSIIGQADFYLTSFVPDTYQNVCVSGSATKIDLMLVSEYLAAGHSIPISITEQQAYEGGFVECRHTGYFKNVAKVDVSSLYPSIMLMGITPKRDDLGVFKTTLGRLTKQRLAYKSLVQTASDNDKHYYAGMDKAIKRMINSFYGYMGTPFMHWSDVAQAAAVTRTGRDIVQDMADQIEGIGGKVLEVDTDGIYFQYPPELSDVLELIPQILVLPKGIKVDIDTKYDDMLLVAAKNYVLYNGTDYKFHGNSLRSRRDEKFGAEFLKICIEALCNDNTKYVTGYYETLQSRILNYDMTVPMLAKRERISDKTMTSDAKKRLKAAVDQTDLEEGDYIYVYQHEDGSYQPVDDKRSYCDDYDRWYYIERLHKFACRLKPVLMQLGIDLPRMKKLDYRAIVG